MIHQFSHLKFCRIKKGEKKPFENDWPNKPYSYEEIQKYIPNENYGVLCGYNGLVIIDCDNELLIEEVLQSLPNTFRVKTGGGGFHNYFFCPEFKDKIVLTKDNVHYGEIQNTGTQCVAPESIHPNGNKYIVLNDEDIATISKEQLLEFASKFRNENKDYSNLVLNDNSEWIKEFINEVVIKWKEGNRQELALSVAGYLRKEKKLGANTVQSIISKICEITNDLEKDMRLRAVIETFKKDEEAIKGIVGLKDKGVNVKKQSLKIFTIEGQVQEFYNTNPFFYDRAGMFWIWDNEQKKYAIADEVDMLNGINDIGMNTINSKDKGEIINALRQYGRKQIPKIAPDSWIQFKNKIYDFKTKELLDSSPEYFITNPIPWNIGESEETPTMDKLFEEWVSKEYVKTLYEVMAYSCSSNQFMQRLIALVGGGANGKGTFLKLLIKFVGNNNCSTSELKELADNQFETASIYRKLLCVMGEISYDDLKNTNQIKKLSGEDQIRYCFKGKTPFSEKSITTIISATNSLPNTPDKTVGFYRKWLIVDFPNQFQIKEGVIDSIPEIEFENLAKKVISIITGLHKSQRFTNEGSIEERIAKYEQRSNPLLKFIDSHCLEEMGYNLDLRLFCNQFNKYAQENHLRVQTVKQIAKNLREEGFDIGRRKYDNEFDNATSKQVILNLMFKNKEMYHLNTKNTIFCSQSPCKV